MRNLVGEIVLLILLLVLLAVLVNPFNLLMPSMAIKMLVTFLLIIFGILAGLIWRERPRDERESAHQAIADRAGFLIGAAVLVVGIVAGELAGELNLWLPAALATMVAVKLVALIYYEHKN